MKDLLDSHAPQIKFLALLRMLQSAAFKNKKHSEKVAQGFQAVQAFKRPFRSIKGYTSQGRRTSELLPSDSNRPSRVLR